MVLLFTKKAVTETGDMRWAPNTLSLPSKQETKQFQPHPSMRVLRLCNAVVSQTFTTPKWRKSEHIFPSKPMIMDDLPVTLPRSDIQETWTKQRRSSANWCNRRNRDGWNSHLTQEQNAGLPGDAFQLECIEDRLNTGWRTILVLSYQNIELIKECMQTGQQQAYNYTRLQVNDMHLRDLHVQVWNSLLYHVHINKNCVCNVKQCRL